MKKIDGYIKASEKAQRTYFDKLENQRKEWRVYNALITALCVLGAFIIGGLIWLLK